MSALSFRFKYCDARINQCSQDEDLIQKTVKTGKTPSHRYQPVPCIRKSQRSVGDEDLVISFRIELREREEDLQVYNHAQPLIKVRAFQVDDGHKGVDWRFVHLSASVIAKREHIAVYRIANCGTGNRSQIRKATRKQKMYYVSHFLSCSGTLFQSFKQLMVYENFQTRIGWPRCRVKDFSSFNMNVILVYFLRIHTLSIVPTNFGKNAAANCIRSGDTVVNFSSACRVWRHVRMAT